jgi:hypothetical protein
VLYRFNQLINFRLGKTPPWLMPIGYDTIDENFLPLIERINGYERVF